MILRRNRQFAGDTRPLLRCGTGKSTSRTRSMSSGRVPPASCRKEIVARGGEM